MNLTESILLLIFTILIFGSSFLFIMYLQDPKNNELNYSICENSGGKWNECGNKCMILNAGNPNIVCLQVCEAICECGTIRGLTCPKDYECILPENITDAAGFCSKI